VSGNQFRYLTVTKTNDKVVVVFKSKRLTDGRVIQRLEREFGNVVRLYPGKRIILDYSGVETQEGRMYRALDFLHKKATDADCDIWMVQMRDEFMRALKDQKMLELFTIRKLLRDALNTSEALSA
jgi:anti-anti-sigma regulatory factor